MLRGLQGIVLLLAVCVVTLSMGACPSVDPTNDPILDPGTDPAQVASPTFDPEGGTFQDSVSVAISCATANATILYTLDGTTPSASNGTVYDGPITLTDTTLILAIACNDTLSSSDVIPAVFTRASSNRSLTIATPSASGTLIQGQPGTLSVTCWVSAENCQIWSVTADLSQVGGPAAQPLTPSANYWTWTGTVIPSVCGTGSIIFTAAADTAETQTASATIVVSAAPPANAAPTISSLAATGQLVAGQTCAVTVSCTASDSDGTISSVRANLSAIGGQASQLLVYQSGQWTWTGSVLPTVTGPRIVTFTAADNKAATATASATISVAANQSPVVSSPVVIGSLVQGQADTVGVSCVVSDPDGSVQSVRADLSAIGGSAAQSLSFSSGLWTWTGSVTPSASGTRTVVLAALDNQGASGTASAAIGVAAPDNQPPSIGSPSAAGTLVLNQAATVTVSCSAGDADGALQSVRANLLSIGGSSTQSLSLAGGIWTWTGSVTPAVAGTRTVSFTATDDDGATATTSTTITVAVPNQPPVLSSPGAAGTLLLGQAGTVTASCTVTDSDGTVQSVTANLSSIGGSASQALGHSGNNWQWSGSVTPAASGTRTITFTATDDDGATATISTTITVSVPNQPPSVSDPQAIGALVEGQVGSITVSCVAVDSDGAIGSVKANLSAIGGSGNQTLVLSSGRYTWTGTLTPPARGNRTITFTATDNQSATASTTATIPVAAPDAPPSVTNPSATGTLVINQSGTVTVTCTASDADGSVQSVTADLSAIGGTVSQPLAFDTDHWAWTGDVTPTSSGSKTITFTATDNAAKTGTASALIAVLGSQPGSLAGSWAGNVTHSQSLVLGGSHSPPTSFVEPSSVTFSAGFQPQSLAICYGQTRTVAQLPAATLLNPGDQATTVWVTSSSTANITATVTQVSRSDAAFSIDMDLQVVYTSGASGTLTGPYHWEATIQPGDQLSWSETTVLTVVGFGAGLELSSTGMLTRQ